MPHNLILLAAFVALVLVVSILSRRSTPGNPVTLENQAMPAGPSGQNYHFRLAELEAKVNFLMDNLGVKYDPPINEQVQGYLARGMKIEAIKAYQNQNPGVGLKDAKDAVEAIESQMKAKIS